MGDGESERARPMTVLLDTCAVLWAVSDPASLSPIARAVLQDPGVAPTVSAISAAEIACAAERGRVVLDRHWKTWFRHYLELNQWECLPVDLAVVEEAYSLPPPFHADPADRILVASARVHGIPVVTGDRRILDYPHVKTVW